jgi:pantoate--beta-alanine ligase
LLETIRDPREMRIRMEDVRRDGRVIGFVPTMGYLHAGHQLLLSEARKRSDVVVLSIFVNPIQFGPKEDLSRYPRDLEGDLAKAQEVGTDFAFVPEAAAMYPEGFQTGIEVRELSQGMCGDKRPGHFAGVATVVAKLFHIVTPHLAVFGEKDYQQLAVIRRMVRDLSFDVTIVGVPTKREPDGLAMSSRNVYLSPSERQDALCLSRALGLVADKVAAGERDVAALEAAAKELLAQVPSARVDYLEIRDAETLVAVPRVERPVVMALAVFVGKTRLIDNRVITPA